MIGINNVYLIGKMRGLRADGVGGRFWLDTSVSYTTRDGEQKTMDDAVLVHAERLPSKDGSVAVKDGSLVYVAGSIENATLTIQGAEVKITEVEAALVSRVEPGTPHMNHLHWAGGLGMDPEMRYTAAGVEVTTLVTVVGGDREKGIPGVWLRATLWRGQAVFANENLAKGGRVTIKGRVFTEKWENREGVPQYTTKAHVDDLLIWERPGGRTGGEQAAPASTGKTRRLDPAPAVSGDEDGLFEETVPGEEVPF